MHGGGRKNKKAPLSGAFYEQQQGGLTWYFFQHFQADFALCDFA